MHRSPEEGVKLPLIGWVSGQARALWGGTPGRLPVPGWDLGRSLGGPRLTRLAILVVRAVNGHPNFPRRGHRRFPTPRVHSVASAGRTRPALSLSLSRYELPRMFRVMA